MGQFEILLRIRSKSEGEANRLPDVEHEGKPNGDHGILRQFSNSLLNLVSVKYSDVVAESHAILKCGAAKIGNELRRRQHNAV